MRPALTWSTATSPRLQGLQKPLSLAGPSILDIPPAALSAFTPLPHTFTPPTAHTTVPRRHCLHSRTLTLPDRWSTR